ncbi:MAG: CYTH and CHAD domain-containing protein [Acidimicrobiales bacterium]
MASDDPSTQMASDQIEIEWQFDALDLRPVERWVTSLPQRLDPGPAGAGTVTALAKPVRRLSDRYLDTEDWRIGRAGYVLRTRRRGQGNEVTLKDLRPAGAGGLRRRLEVTETLGPGGIESLGSAGPVGRRVSAVVGRHDLRQVIEVRTRRRAYALRVVGEEAAELALDETVITAGPGQRPVHLYRVEVEVAPQWLDALDSLVADLRESCGLRPATLSKFEAGLLALGMQIPGPPDLGSTDVNRDSGFGEVALAVIRRHLGVMLAREPGTRLGEDIEELHQMRVSTRRLRAALDFFADALPPRSRSFSSELAWVAEVLGHVRDLDVQIEHIDGMRAWAGAWEELAGSDGSRVDELTAVLAGERDRARLLLLASLDSPRWERLVSGLTAMATNRQVRPPAAARLPATAVLPELVESRHRAVAKAARRAERSGVAADFHRLRIRCKRLRYSLEFTSGVYGSRTDRFTRRLALLQDALGLMQDADVATARLWALVTGTDDEGQHRSLPPPTVFFVGAMAEHYRAESDKLLARMPKRLRLLGGAQWKDLRAHMDRHRSPSAPSALESRRPERTRPGATTTPGAPPVPDVGSPDGLAAPIQEPVDLPLPVPPGPQGPPVPPGPQVPPVPPVPPGPQVPPVPDVATVLAAWPDPVWDASAPTPVDEGAPAAPGTAPSDTSGSG